MPAPFNFHLEQYEGPLDLLLDLIRKQQINIYDIPIASITAQYLEYLQRAMEMDIDLGAEFVYMAATLIHIKSKLLLPRDPELEKISPEEDPRKELVDRLLEHERFKNAAEMLQQKRMVEEAVWSNPQIESFLSEDDDPGLAVTLFELVKSFQQVLDRTKNRPIYEIDKEDVSVPDMMRFLERSFRQHRRSDTISFVKLVESQRSRRAMVCLFLAVLELVKRNAIELTQMEAFGEIGLRKHQDFEAALQSGPELESIEQEYI
ncbi:MAG TPA: segregation/condensation protein A [Bryobacteraceae bacterium]|nr:segregation/condensation protein A [Bryobacteraceae bacterium]